LKYSELVRKLRRLGVVLDEQRKRHEYWHYPKNNSYTAIPRHHSGEIPTGTLENILKDLGIGKDELRDA